MIQVYKFVPSGSFIHLLRPITKVVLKENYVNCKPNIMNQFISHEEIKTKNSLYFFNQTIDFNPICAEYSQVLNLKTSILTRCDMDVETKFSIYEDIQIALDNSKTKTYNYSLSILGNYNPFLRPCLYNYELKNIKSESVLNLENEFKEFLTTKLFIQINKDLTRV